MATMSSRVSAVIFFVLALVSGRALANGVAGALPPDLAGLWGTEIAYGMPLAGELVVDGRSGRWLASIAGVQGELHLEGDDLRGELPGNGGGVRARLGRGGRALRGFWIQPPGKTLAQAYATPIGFQSSEPRVWRGTVEPLADRISLYLTIERAADGTLAAWFRNPDFNFDARNRYRVEHDAGTLALVDVRQPGRRIRGWLDADNGHLMLDYQGVGVFDLSRRGRDEAIGFHATTPADAARTPPLRRDDGWPVARPDDAGLDAARIEALVARLARSETPDARAPAVHGLLLARNGRLVVEQYFHGYSADRPHDTRSAGKSLTPLLLGAARARDPTLDLDGPIAAEFPDLPAPADGDPRRARVTIAQALSMASGWACDDNDDGSPGNEDVMQRQRAERDWYRYTLALPFARDPGASDAVYCSAGIHLAGGVAARRAKLSLPDLFQRALAGPLGIKRYHWNLAPTGDGYAAGGVRLRPRDLLKVGQLMLDDGTWRGRRVLPSDWVRTVLAPRTRFEPDHEYGLGWHLRTVQTPSGPLRTYSAEGNGGQLLIVAPSLDLVLLITAGNYGDFGTWSRFLKILPEEIVPAIVK